jgi:hypothetical protein
MYDNLPFVFTFNHYTLSVTLSLRTPVTAVPSLYTHGEGVEG